MSEWKLREQDVRIDGYVAGLSGFVRITHLPSGQTVVVNYDDGKRGIAREQAWSDLKAKLAALPAPPQEKGE